MSKKLVEVCSLLQDGLLAAEKRHRRAYSAASNKEEWAAANREAALVLRYTMWRQALSRMQEELLEADALQDEDFPFEPPTWDPLADVDEQLLPKPPQPTGFLLLGQHYGVSSWDELYTRLCEALVVHAPYAMATLDKEASFNSLWRTRFSYLPQEMGQHRLRLPNGLWMDTAEFDSSFLDTCHRLLERCGIASDELVIDLAEATP